jgi:hypothetical protein
MPIELDLNQSPFFDDFDESKNFHRILFRPGYAVQARELTQMQTILQNQVERGFNEFLVDGTIITGVPLKTESVQYVKLRDKDANNRVILTTDFFDATGTLINAVAYGMTTGVSARLVDVKEGSEVAANTAGNFSIFVQYLDSGTDKATKTFANNEVLVVYDQELGRASGFAVASNTISTSMGGATGKGFRATVGDGIVYHKGHFVRVAPQSAIVEKFSNTPTRIIGFETTESTIDSDQDSSLLENATGSTNFAAPGAERLKLYPTLTSRVEATANTTTFFPIATVEGGQIIKRNKDTVYSDLGKYISDRMYETNGDYIVKPFNVRIREHLKSATNLGRYAAGSTPAGDTNKLVAEIEPGIGYVRGNRHEFNSTIFRPFDKATDFETKDARTLSQSYGNYVIVDECVGSFDQRSFRTVSLRSAAANAITNRTHGATSAPGSEIGTARVRGFQTHSGTVGTASGQHRVYLFDIEMDSGYSFKDDVKSMYFNATTGTDALADVVLESSKAILKETNKNTLVFPFAQKGTKTLKDASDVVDTQFVFRQNSKVTFNSDNNRQGTLSIANTATGGTETMQDSVTTAADRSNYIIVATSAVVSDNLAGTVSSSGTTITGSGTAFDTDFAVGDFILADSQLRIVATIASSTSMTVDTAPSGAWSSDTYARQYPAGHIFDFSNDGTGSSDASSTSRTLDVGGPAIASSWTGEVIYNVNRTSSVASSKTAHKDVYVHINTGSHSASADGPWALGVPDAYKLTAVYTGSNTGVLITDTNIIDEFILDNGQKDAFYDTSYLKKRSTSTLNTTNVGMLAKFSWFDEDKSSGRGFYSVDSYPVDDSDPTASGNISTQEIPQFVSPTTGKAYDLRDGIDYRPRLANTCAPSTTGTVAAAPTNPAALTVIAHDAVYGSYIATPDENFQADVQYYLPRKDNIVLSALGNLEVVKGIPNISPQAPFDVGESMVLATLSIPVYPSLSSHVARIDNRRDYEVRMEVKNNRRFTMKDLRGINQRVKNLEYYVSLNALESSAKNKQIFNSSGQDRFKNGIFVDNFDNLKNVDTENEGFRAAIDKNESMLRPVFKRRDVALEQSTDLSSTNITKTGNILTLSYSNTVFVSQTKATKLRNPVQEVRYIWNGSIKLNPEIDNTPDTTTLPDIQIDFDGFYESISKLAGLVIGEESIEWGAWNTVQNTRQTTENPLSAQVTQITTTLNEEQIRSGMQTVFGSGPSENFEIGNFIENVSVRDYMRSKEIKFSAFNMRPNTTVFPYFDDELVRRYCTPTNSAYANTGLIGGTLQTDSSGSVYGRFLIPNDDTLKFRIGERMFELKDVANTQTQSSLTSTRAHGYYSSTPLDIIQRGTTVSITTPEISVNTINETRLNSSTTTSFRFNEIFEGESGGDDPLAQTFTVQTNDQADGIFVVKLDLYFGSKSSTYPVTVEIREVVNGVPTNTVVPFGRKTLLPAAVTVDAVDGSEPTAFVFDSPVFLKNSTDYAMVIKPAGNNDEYTVWSAELGAKDVISDETIFKPADSRGVMLVSSNDKTYTAIQKEDLKYRIHRASFSSSGTTYIENKNYEFLTFDSVSGTGFTVGEKVRGESIIVIANNQTVSVGDIVQNYAALRAVANTELYANGVVREIITTGSKTLANSDTVNATTLKVDGMGLFTNSTPSNYHRLYVGSTLVGNTIEYSTNTVSGFVDSYDLASKKLRLTESTASGTTLGTYFANGYYRGMKSGTTIRMTNTTSDNLVMNMTVPKVPQIVYANTAAAWSIRPTSTSGVISSSYVNTDLGIENYFFDGEKKIYSKTNEIGLSAVGGSKKSYVLKGSLSTTNDKMSPIIHLGKTNAIAVENVINNDATDEHKNVGNATVRYVTKAIELGKDQDAEDLKVFIHAYKPIGTGVGVYARLLNNEDGQSISDKSWTPLTQITSSNTFSDSINTNDILEYEFGLVANTDGLNFLSTSGANTFVYLDSSDSSIAKYENSDGAIYSGYKTFAIKIVLTSTGTNTVPLVQNLRALALQV